MAGTVFIVFGLFASVRYRVIIFPTHVSEFFPSSVASLRVLVLFRPSVYSLSAILMLIAFRCDCPGMSSGRCVVVIFAFMVSPSFLPMLSGTANGGYSNSPVSISGMTYQPPFFFSAVASRHSTPCVPRVLALT